MKDEFITIPQIAKLLGLSRIAVYKKVKSGEISAVKIGKTYAIPKKLLLDILGKSLSQDSKKEIDRAIKKTVDEYGETLRLLGKE